MRFRLCGLALAVFLAACSGGSESEPEKSPSTFAPTKPAPEAPVQVTTQLKPKPGSAIFSYGPDDNIARQLVSDEPTSKRQTAVLNGVETQITATAGHLIASGSKRIGNSTAYMVTNAAVFYTAYTRDDLPKENRPVTFVFNGGPGDASSALDVSFLGPKSYDAGASKKARTLLWKDNPNSLIGTTDLVFVDPVGTGYSVAIAPDKNSDFWGVDSDAKVLRSFITRYINANNRQSSPKYIYGVSYGGLRAPIIGQLLLEKGANEYLPDPSNKRPIILSGLILNSPVLDRKTNCYGFPTSCQGALPTYAMVKAFHDKSLEKPGFDLPAFLTSTKAFARTFGDLYNTVFARVNAQTPNRAQWEAYLKKPEAEEFLNRLYQLTGIGKLYAPGDNANNNPWIANPNMNSAMFVEKFAPDKGKLVIGDGRYFLGKDEVDPALDHKDFYHDFLKSYQAEFINYKAQSNYIGSNGTIISKWNYVPDQIPSIAGDRLASAIPDLTYSMTLNPKLKVLIQHGYYDLNTPFHQTELDIEQARLSSRIPVKSYPAGHGIDPQGMDDYENVLAELRAVYDHPAMLTLAGFNTSPTEARQQ